MDIAQTITEFRDAVIAKGSEGGPKDHDLYDTMVATYQALYAHGNKGIEAFRSLLEDSSPDVRCWVAAQLLATGNSSVLPVLETISEGSGILALNARMTLREFSAGSLKPPLGEPT